MNYLGNLQLVPEVLVDLVVLSGQVDKLCMVLELLRVFFHYKLLEVLLDLVYQVLQVL